MNANTSKNISLTYYNSMTQQTEDFVIQINNETQLCHLEDDFVRVSLYKQIQTTLTQAQSGLNLTAGYMNDQLNPSNIYNQLLGLSTTYQVLSDMNTLTSDLVQPGILTYHDASYCTTC